jgi:hypothetical protein
MFSHQDANFLWFGLLVTITVISAYGITTSNLYRNPRPHDTEKLINECLAGHQLVYINFYGALLVAAKNHLSAPATRNILILLALALFWFSLAHRSVKLQDHKLRNRGHYCALDCDAQLPWRLQLTVYRWNLALAFLSFIPAMALSFNPVLAAP